MFTRRVPAHRNCGRKNLTGRDPVRAFWQSPASERPGQAATSRGRPEPLGGPDDEHGTCTRCPADPSRSHGAASVAHAVAILRARKPTRLLPSRRRALDAPRRAHLSRARSSRQRRPGPPLALEELAMPRSKAHDQDHVDGPPSPPPSSRPPAEPPARPFTMRDPRRPGAPPDPLAGGCEVSSALSATTSAASLSTTRRLRSSG